MYEIRLVGPGAEPCFVREFALRQRRSYAEFAVQQVAENIRESECEGGHGVYFVVAVEDSTSELVGGLRIHRAQPDAKLPVERALSVEVGKDILLPFGRSPRMAEMSGLWVRPNLRGMGLSNALMRAGVACMPLIHVLHAIAFTHQYVLDFWTPMGFAVDYRFGTHPYPDVRYQSSLIWIDTVTLERAHFAQRALILAMRDELRRGGSIRWSPETGPKSQRPLKIASNLALS